MFRRIDAAGKLSSFGARPDSGLYQATPSRLLLRRLWIRSTTGSPGPTRMTAKRHPVSDALSTGITPPPRRPGRSLLAQSLHGCERRVINRAAAAWPKITNWGRLEFYGRLFKADPLKTVAQFYRFCLPTFMITTGY